MTAPETALRDAWHHLAGREHEHLLEQLLTHYREPHRRYHTATHVMMVLRHITDLAAAHEREAGAPALDLPALRLAVLYHDIVYDPAAADNEARSAVLAASAACDLGWPSTRCELVASLVRCTAGHQPFTDPAQPHAARQAMEAVLIDADLAILGARPNDYAAYARAVRSEYAHLANDEWVVGRRAVLRHFLAQPKLFHTAAMRTARETRARANLTAELAALG